MLLRILTCKKAEVEEDNSDGFYDKEMTDIIAGTFLVVGLGEENFTSLSDGLQKKYADIFKNPEEFVRLGNEIVAIPVKPSIKQQLNQAKKEQGEREDKKLPSHKPPEL